MYCNNCGSQINEGQPFCRNCGAEITIPYQNSLIAPSTVIQQNNPVNTGYTYSMKFYPAGIPGIVDSFIITDRSIIIANKEYAYSTMDNLVLVDNNLAQTYSQGKTLSLSFKEQQRYQFAESFEYANKQIDNARHIKRKYIYSIFSGLNKVQVYTDFIIISVFSYESSDTIVEFDKLDVALDTSRKTLFFLYNNQRVVIDLTPQNIQKAQEIANYILNTKSELKKYEQEETITPCSGNEVSLPLLNTAISITSEMDLFNNYKYKFRSLALRHTEKADKEIKNTIYNLSTFLDLFPQIYGNHLSSLAKEAINLLIQEGIWTITNESFVSEHLKSFHSALDEYESVFNNALAVVQSKQNAVNTINALSPRLVGGGFGLQGALTGIATATAFNLAVDGLASGMFNNAKRLDPKERYEIFSCIDFNKLINLIYNDYSKINLLFSAKIKEAGKAIWLPSSNDIVTANNIFQNLSNPHFPESKKLEVFIEILKTYPYDEEYHKYMLSMWGRSAETLGISNYFGVKA